MFQQTGIQLSINIFSKFPTTLATASARRRRVVAVAQLGASFYLFSPIMLLNSSIAKCIDPSVEHPIAIRTYKY